MNIGAVIVAHNSKEYIHACIASIVSEGIEKIVVVDSASTDGTILQVHPLVHTISLLENKGFAVAANSGAKLMNTDYVLFINPDAYLQKGALKYVQDTLNHIPNIGALGMALEDVHHVPEKQSFGIEPRLRNLFLRKVSNSKLLHVPFQVDWVSGGAMVVNHELFSRLGGFDERFFLYWEDVDLCKQIREVGYTVWVDPRAHVAHIRGASQANQGQKTHMYDVSADRYYTKHYPPSIWITQRIFRKLYRIIRPNVW